MYAPSAPPMYPSLIERPPAERQVKKLRIALLVLVVSLITLIGIGLYVGIPDQTNSVYSDVCDGGFFINQNQKCFIIVPASVAQDKASTLCNDMYAATLLEVLNDDEAALISDLAQMAFGITNDVWVSGQYDGGCNSLFIKSGQTMPKKCELGLSFACEKRLNKNRPLSASFQDTMTTVERSTVSTWRQLTDCISNRTHGGGGDSCVDKKGSLIPCHPTISMQPLNGRVSVYEGSPFTLTCSPQGDPIPAVSWTLPSGIKQQTTIFTVESSTADQSGQYVCKASNGVSPDAYGEFVVVVGFTPRVKISRREEVGPSGLVVVLTCQVESNPKAKIYWVDNKSVRLEEVKGSPIPGGFTVSADLTFVISKEPLKATAYSCMAVNDYGMMQSELVAIGSPPLDARVENEHFVDGNGLFVTGTATSKFNVHEFKFYFRTYPVDYSFEVTTRTVDFDPNSSNFSATVKVPVYVATAFKVNVAARNSFGWSDVSPVVRVDVKPTNGSRVSSCHSVVFYLFAAVIAAYFK